METKFALKVSKSTDLSSRIKITNIINTNILRYLFSNCTDMRRSQPEIVKSGCHSGLVCDSGSNGRITNRSGLFCLIRLC